MQERTSGPETLPKPNIIQDNNHKAEAFIKGTFEYAAALQACSYESEEEAMQATSDFARYTQELLDAADGINTVIFRISGTGVHTPTFSIGEAHIEGKAAAYAVALESAEYKPLDIFESLDVRFHSTLMSTSYDEADSLYHAHAELVMTSAYPQAITMGGENVPMPIGTILVYPSYIAECNDTTIVEIPELEEKRAKARLMQEVATSGLTDTVFRRSLNKLRREFLAEDRHDFMDLEDLSVLHTLGKVSDERARQGSSHSDLMSRAILSAIGDHRIIEVGGIPSGKEDSPTDIIMTGPIVGVLLPESADDTLLPALVIESTSEDETMAFFQYPLEHISSLRF